MPDNFTCQEEGAATQWVNNKAQFKSNGCLTQGRILVEIVGEVEKIRGDPQS